MAKKKSPARKQKAPERRSASRPAAKARKKPTPVRPAAGKKSVPPGSSSAAARRGVRPNEKRSGKTPPVLHPIVLPPLPKVEAPGKFRREYKRWKATLISLRHRLLSEGSHLEEEGLKALEQEVSVDHMADFGSDSSEQETTLQLIENNSLSLRDVDDALKRIEAKTYGLCEDCEALIPPARLAVLPHARLCIACQSKREGMPA